jgi:hypothetical protein
MIVLIVITGVKPVDLEEEELVRCFLRKESLRIFVIIKYPGKR